MIYIVHKKLPSPQLVKNSPHFFGTRRFITTFKSARHLSSNSVCASPSHLLMIHFNLILLSALGHTHMCMIYIHNCNEVNTYCCTRVGLGILLTRSLVQQKLKGSTTANSKISDSYSIMTRKWSRIKDLTFQETKVRNTTPKL
jgi:hypothetical protein